MVVAALALLAVVAVLVAWWVQTSTGSPLTSDAAPGPLIVPVERTERTARFGVGVSVEYEEGTPVTVAVSGMVTEVLVRTGDVLDSGDVIATVNDVPVLAMVAAAPLWRDLAPASVGDDVARLQRFLADLGLYDGAVDGRYGAATARAVTQFNDAHGRHASGGRFVVGSVAWVGDAPLEVAAVDVAVGGAVGVGDPLVAGPRRATGIVIAEPTGGIPAGGQFNLVVGTAATPYPPGSGLVTDPDAVATIAASLGTTGEGAGQVISAETETVLAVPASAVVVDQSGTSCVFEDVDGVPVAVQVLGGTLATAELPPETPVSRVLANPLQTRAETSCG